MRIDHVLGSVGDQLPAGKAVQHAAVAHGDAVVDRDGVELLGDATGPFDLAGHQLTQILEVHVARTNWVKELAIAMIGLSKSSSVMPVARQSERAPAMFRPWVVVRERYSGISTG